MMNKYDKITLLENGMMQLHTPFTRTETPSKIPSLIIISKK